MAITRELPQLPVELLETYSEERIPFYHPARASTCIKQINRLSIMLKTESTLLQKIRYKQKNQHKSATWWRHVSGSQRVSLRLLEQLEGGIMPNLPTVEDKQPVITGNTLVLLSENIHRVLLFLDRTVTFHTKAAAAAQQLLRAALFMPVAMTLKALIARLHTIWTCLHDECQVFLSLLRASPKKKSQIALNLDSHITTLPRELRKYWTATAPKGSSKSPKNTHGVASTSASAASSTVPSRTQSPALTRQAETTKSKLSQSQTAETREEIVVSQPVDPSATIQASATNTGALDARKPEPQAQPTLTAVPSPEVAAKVKKVKKRKRVAAGDDIDAIFAGL